MLLAVAFLQFDLSAQSKEIKFKFSAESNVNNASKIELNISKLLSAINVACIDSKPISYMDIRIDSTAVKNLDSFWQNMHFYCEDVLNVSKCLEGLLGFQVRDIPITLKPQVSFDEGLQRELTVTLTKTGVITAVHLALPNNQVRDILEEGKTVTEVRERSEILKFVEDFRCYYNEKNITALEQVYADDALIITGTVLQQNGRANFDASQVKVKYRKENKPEYIERMRRLFLSKEFVDVTFDLITVQRHRAKPMYYGVTLHQHWKTKAKGPDGKVYEDDGWLFLLWDFSNPQQPQIHVRTWQPDEFVKERKDVFELNDFKL